MAISTNRSPSPLSSKRRNPDSNPAPRRSFTGNPFPRPPALSNPRNSFNPVTPANSPAAGFGRKTTQVHDEKENEKDPAPAKSSLAMNGTKSFMAPTISATSKFTPSPRKKVLAERNDPVRTSITLSEGKATFFSGVESPVGNTEQKDDVFSTSKVSKKVTFSDDCVSNSKNSASSPIIAPLDADPFVLPYDPKTNCYSPRPQFLHYKPNPRIEVLLDQEMGDELGIPRSLEDNLLEVLSESFSDTDSAKGSISGDDSQKGSEDILPEGAEEEDLRAPESTIDEVLEESESEIITNLPEIDGVSVEEAKGDEAFEAMNNNGRQKKSLWKPVFVLLVLLVTGASLWADVSPFTSSSVFEALESPKIDVFRKGNLDELGTRFQKLSFDSISRLSSLMSKLGGGGGHFAGDVHFLNLNLTDIEDHNGFSICLKDERKTPEQMEEDIEEGDEEEEQSESEVQILEPTYPEMDSDDIEDWESEDFTKVESDESVTNNPSILGETSQISEADMNVASSEEREPEVTSETVHSVVEDISSDNVVLPENLDHERIKVAEEPEIASETVNPVEEEEEEDASSEKLQDTIFQIIAPLVAALVSAAASFFLWKRSIRVLGPKVVDSVPKKVLQHFSAEEGGSGSSEMSSSRSEVHDKKERKRRDSMASSSADFSAYSYGSFTTYEKISSKNAIGEGEILTPVRRSSRIRSHVSS